MLKNFFNTIKLYGKQLKEAQEKATNQDERIYLIFSQNRGKKMTPFEVLDIYKKLYKEVPITSIRRSLTYLSTPDKEGKSHLVKTEEMRNGKYAKPNHLWKFAQ